MVQPAYIQPVPIAEDLRSILVEKMGEAKLSSWASEAIVVEAIRENVISRKKGASLLGLDDIEAREAFFERHQLHNEYTVEMLEQDLASISLRQANSAT